MLLQAGLQQLAAPSWPAGTASYTATVASVDKVTGAVSTSATRGAAAMPSTKQTHN